MQQATILGFHPYLERTIALEISDKRLVLSNQENIILTTENVKLSGARSSQATVVIPAEKNWLKTLMRAVMLLVFLLQLTVYDADHDVKRLVRILVANVPGRPNRHVGNRGVQQDTQEHRDRPQVIEGVQTSA